MGANQKLLSKVNKIWSWSTLWRGAEVLSARSVYVEIDCAQTRASVRRADILCGALTPNYKTTYTKINKRQIMCHRRHLFQKELPTTYLRCVRYTESQKILADLHEGECKSNTGG